MKVAVGFDHRGVHLREAVLAVLADEDVEVVDLGVETDEKRVDYPDVARDVGMAIRSGRAQRGVLVCGSGVGASIAASKIPGIRAAICHDPYSAAPGRRARRHERALPRLGGHRRRRWRRFSSSTSSTQRSSARARYLARLEKVEELEKLVDG